MTSRNVETPVLLATLFALVAVVACFIQWLPNLPPGERLNTLELLTMPPWYKNPRLEAFLLMAALAGFMVSSVWAMGQARRDRRATNATPIARRRVVAAVVLAFLTGVHLALNASAQ